MSNQDSSASTFLVNLEIIKLNALGVCKNNCTETLCPICASVQKYLYMGFDQPCDSIIMMPTIFFQRSTQHYGPIMYHAILSFYMSVLDVIQDYCDPSVRLPWHDDLWHVEHEEARKMASVQLTKRQPRMSKEIKLNIGNTHASVLGAFEKCIFEEMAVIHEVAIMVNIVHSDSQESMVILDERIQSNLKTQVDSSLTLSVIQVDKGRSVCDNFEAAEESVKVWNETKNHKAS